MQIKQCRTRTFQYRLSGLCRPSRLWPAPAPKTARALASGFQMCVAMPINTDELIAIVASLTGHIRY